MNRFESAFRCLVPALAVLDVPWALVGGLAISIQATPRRYRDIDITVVAPDEHALDALPAELRARGHNVYRIAHEMLGLVLVVHVMLRKADPSGVLVDLLPRASGFEVELVAAAQPREVFGIVVPVARLGHLIARKAKAIADLDRPKDWWDLQDLLAQADVKERVLAQEALRLSSHLRGTRAFEVLEQR